MSLSFLLAGFSVVWFFIQSCFTEYTTNMVCANVIDRSRYLPSSEEDFDSDGAMLIIVPQTDMNEMDDGFDSAVWVPRYEPPDGFIPLLRRLWLNMPIRLRGRVFDDHLRPTLREFEERGRAIAQIRRALYRMRLTGRSNNE